ncbi:uncharacterized protein LOC142584361 [Dermacentor variabilis]|uniref:uncharacterized protein LOC142584361 n=1 Tax=Dermacentor variabilis TaxID=34621 RepID=UPI003F5B2D9D
MAEVRATALRDAGAPVHKKACPAEEPTPNLKEIDRRRLLGNRVAREDSKKKKQSASVRPRQVHHPVARRPAGTNIGNSSRVVVDRPLSGGSARRRTGDQGFSAFLEQCKRLLVTASYRGSVKNPLDALGVVFLSFLAARFPLERYFLRRQKSSRAGVGSAATGARKPRAIEDHSPMSDAVLLSVDKETRKARCTTVQIGQGRQAAATKVGEPGAKAPDGCGVSKHRQQPEHKGKPVEELVPVLTLPQAADVFQHMAGFLGPAILQQAGKGTSCVPGSADRQQRCPRFGRGFLAIRHSKSVFQTEEWKPRGRSLYKPLTNDMMINALSVDQLSFESGQFFLADGTGNYAGAKSGHAIHFWRYNNVEKRLFVSQSVFFLNEEDYTGVLEQLEYI